MGLGVGNGGNYFELCQPTFPCTNMSFMRSGPMKDALVCVPLSALVSVPLSALVCVPLSVLMCINTYIDYMASLVCNAHPQTHNVYIHTAHPTTVRYEPDMPQEA